MTVDAVDLVEPTVLVYGPDDALEDVSEQLRRFERLDTSLVHREVLVAERVPEEVTNILLLGEVFSLTVSIQNVLLEAHDAAEF